MNHIARFFEALHISRQCEADRVIRRYRHLIEEAHAYDHKREIEAASNTEGRATQKPSTATAKLCSSQI